MTGINLNAEELVTEAVDTKRAINWTRVGKLAGIAAGVAVVAVGVYVVVTKVVTGEASVTEAVEAVVENAKA